MQGTLSTDGATSPSQTQKVQAGGGRTVCQTFEVPGQSNSFPAGARQLNRKFEADGQKAAFFCETFEAHDKTGNVRH